MPQALLVLPLLALEAGLIGAAVAAGASVAASLVAAGYQKRLASRQAREVARNQQVLIRSATVSRRVVYGRAMVSGPIAFAESTGDANNTLHLVIPLCEGEIDAVEEVYLNEKPVSFSSFDANGNPTTGAFVSQRREDFTVTATPNGSGAWSATVPTSGVIISVTSNTPESIVDGAFGGSSTITFSRSGTTVSGTGVPVANTVVIAYYTETDISGSGTRLKIRAFTGSSTQAASSELIAAVPAKWTSDHRLRGIAYLYVVLTRDETLYPLGLPNIKARIRGKRVLDPRTSTTGFSENWALCVRDYLVSYCGVASADIDTTKLNAAANKCDEAVLTAGRPAVADYGVTALTRNSSTEPRFTCNGVVDLSQSSQDVLEQLMTQSSGLLTWTEGKWQIRAGSYEAPNALLYFDDGDVIEPMQIQPRTRVSELFNAARGRYVSAEQGYIDFDATPYKSATYKAQDNNVDLFADFSLPFCRTNSEAQRLLRLTLERARRQMVAEITVGIAKGMLVQAGDTIALTSTRHGFTNKVFRVLRWSWASPQACKLTLKEEDSGWDSWTALDAANTLAPVASLLPDPFTPPTLAGLNLDSGAPYARVRTDGVVEQSARIFWTASANPTVLQGGRIEVEYRPSWTTAGWLSAGAVDGAASQVIVGPVSPNAVYIVRARAVTSIGVPGAYVYHSEVIAGPNSDIESASDNSLSNSNFRNGVSGWQLTATGTGAASFTGGSAAAFVATNPAYVLAGNGTLFGFEDGARPSNNITAAFLEPVAAQVMTVTPGRRVEVSVYIDAHNCTADLLVEWRNSTGTLLSTTTVVAAATSQFLLNLQSLSSWTRIGGFATAPANAATARVRLRKNGAITGSGSTLFSTLWFLGLATDTQASLSPWSEGSLRNVDTADIAPGAATTVFSTSIASGSTAFWNNANPQPAATSLAIPSQQVATALIVSLTFRGSFTANGAATLWGSGSAQGYATVSGGDFTQTLFWCVAPRDTANFTAVGTCALRARFELPANTAVTLSAFISSFEWTGSQYRGVSYEALEYQVEVIKR